MSTSPTPTSTPLLGAPSGAWLVARREMTARLRSRAFVISTAILLLAVLVSVVVGSIASASASTERPRVAAVGEASARIERGSGLAVRDVDTVAQGERLVRSGRVDAAVVADGSARGVRVIAKDDVPLGIVQALSVAPRVTLLEQQPTNPALRYLVAIGFGIVFFVSATTFGSTIAQSVVQEKQTRVVEILLSTLPARTLLAGKVLGNSLLAFAQIAIIALISAGGLAFTGQLALLGMLGPSIAWFVVFFVIGFVLLASMFAAAASLVSRQEDMAAVTTPVTMLVMAPYILVIVFNDNPIVLGVMSFVPFSAPVGMPVRIFLGQAAWWEPLVALAVLAATTVIVIVLGARVYSNALLRMGGRVRLGQALER